MNPQIKTTYQGGEALPTIGSTGYNEVLKLSGFQPSNVLDAGNLTQGTSTPTFNFQPVNSASTNLSAQVGSVINGISTAPTATATPTAQPVTDRNTILERLYSLIGMQGEQTGRTADIQEEVGLFKKQETLTKLENDITARAKAWDDQVKELEKNKEGLSDQGLQIRRNALLKDKNSELADLSIQYKVANDDVQGALALAEAKVASEFEPMANEIDALKGLYTLYGSDLTDSEKILLQDQINEKESAMDFERQKALIGYKAMIDSAMSGGSTSGISDLNAYVTAYQAGQIPLTQVPQGIRGQVLAQAQATGTSKMLGLLQEYRNVLSGLNYGTANLPKNKALLDGIKGQITATYKQQQQLGTLDAGVQKLIDQIIPDPSKLSISSLSNSAQLTALDNFIKNQGGVVGVDNPNEQIYQDVVGTGSFLKNLFKGIF